LADIGHRKSVLAPLIDRLVKWHRFMMEHGPSGLSHEEQQGLFGEVWLLQEKILTLMPSFDAIGSWKGPEGSPHDFILPRGNLEVKSLEESSSIQISSEFQLDGSCVKSLKLAVLGLREVDTGGITLPTLIENTRKRIEVNKEAGSLFEKRLLQAGYLDEHKGNYSSNYQVKDLMLFDIVDGFPRIIKPATGVKSVRYELELSFCQKYRTDPSEAITALVKEE
jgi:hypothetical protein